MPANPDEPVGSRARWTFDPSLSPWWKLMRRPGVRIQGTRAYNKFRRKFRLPLTEVEKLVAEAQTVKQFKDKPPGPGNGRGHARHPLLIKVLAALRCLAKGVDVEDVEDAAYISATTLHHFVPAFLKWIADTIYPRVVRLPEGEHLEKSLQVYEKLGHPGCCTTTDGVHLAWNACPAKDMPLFRGKEGYPTLAFNVSVLPSTEIIHVADWMPGAKNDKTQAVHDELFHKLRAGAFHPEKEYLLYCGDGTVIHVKGLYSLVDGGYHEWRILQCPLSAAAGDEAAEWSEHLESVRKAVECTFGILKKRFRILARDFECRQATQISDTFRACCALHNILLRYDDRDTMGHFQADWAPERALLERAADWDARCRAVVRAPYNKSAANSQREPGHTILREQLITHFAQAKLRGEVWWLHTRAHARPRPTW